MNKNISWVLELSIKPGRLDDFNILMVEMVGATQANEPGTLNYEWFISPDNSTCHIYERYEDSAAVILHLDTFGKKFAERFMNDITVKNITVYGLPDAELIRVLDGFGARYLAPFGGFAR